MPGQVLLSERFFKEMEQLRIFREQEAFGRIQYTQREAVVSKVTLRIYEVRSDMACGRARCRWLV